jgi:hypothetical protein
LPAVVVPAAPPLAPAAAPALPIVPALAPAVPVPPAPADPGDEPVVPEGILPPLVHWIADTINAPTSSAPPKVVSRRSL